MDTYEIFLVAPPGLESLVAQEAADLGFTDPKVIPGGVTFQGTLTDVARANLCLRGPARVLLRIASFRAMHLSQLDKRARKVDWAKILRADIPFTVEATCRKSKIYHSGAAAERISKAIIAGLGAPHSKMAAVTLKVRIEDDFCTISVDTTGEALHKRGHKGAVGKAPIRENLAALCLRACGFTGQEPLVDPMCGSGTFPIEAAEIALGLPPGRSRSFAFEQLAFAKAQPMHSPNTATDHKFYGFDRDTGAIASSVANAKQAGVDQVASFAAQAISDLQPPAGPPGLVIVNPPYGARIGDKRQLFGLYGALGKTLKDRFGGWRVGLVTSEPSLAKATNLEWADTTGPFPNGSIRITLYQSGPLP